MRILVAEDDRRVAYFIKKELEAEGYAVDSARDGGEALYMAGRAAYDGIILELGLRGADGVPVLRQMRTMHPSVPILALAGHVPEDRVHGLDSGANDYLTKPFSFLELKARLRALTRVERPAAGPTLCVGGLELNLAGRFVERDGRRIELTSREFALLEFLMRNARRCVTRAMIIENVWNMSRGTKTNVVEVYINYLRKKVDANFEEKLIRTVRGVGYELGGPVEHRRAATCNS